MMVQMALRCVETTERIKVSSYNIVDRALNIIADNGNEYLVFRNIEDANMYAVNKVITSEDDPTFIYTLSCRNHSIEDYAKMLVDMYKAEHILSYNQKHKSISTKGLIIYRTI